MKYQVINMALKYLIRAPLKIFNIIPTFNEKLEFLETNEINYYFMLKLALFWLNVPNFTLQKGGFLHFFKLQTYFSYSTSRNVSCYKLHSSCLPSTDYASILSLVSKGLLVRWSLTQKHVLLWHAPWIV